MLFRSVISFCNTRIEVLYRQLDHVYALLGGFELLLKQISYDVRILLIRFKSTLPSSLVIDYKMEYA